MTSHIFVVRRFGSISDSWSEHPGKTFDETVEFATEKVRDGKASLPGLEVVELVEVRRVMVRPEVASITVTEATETPS